MADTIHVASAFARWFPPESRRSIDAMAIHIGVDITHHRKRSLVSAATLSVDQDQTLEVFFKAYARRQHLLDGFARRSLGAVEARNLENFQRWGIRTPAVVAWGTRRSLRGLCGQLSFLITEAAPATLALLQFWTGLDLPENPETRSHVIDELATQTRRLHAHQFFHQDLKWRNVLIDAEGILPKCWWIDCPNGYFSRLSLRQRHGRIKDLATLDMVARKRCTVEERLRFLRVYLQESADSALVDAWAKAITRYRKRRFD